MGLAYVFVAVLQRVDAIRLDPALGIERGKCCLIEMHPEDLVVFISKHVHPVFECLPVEEGVLVVLVVDLFLCHDFGGALCFLYVFVALEQDGVHLGAQAHNLRDRLARALVLHLADDFLVKLAVEGMVLGIVTRVAVPELAPHVFVDIFRLFLWIVVAQVGIVCLAVALHLC